MKRLFFLLFVPFVFMTDATAAEWKIHAYGYGPVLAGMSIVQAERLLGTKLRSENQSTEDPYFFRPAQGSHKDVHFMVSRGKIVHAEVRLTNISTDAGIRVGDPATKIKKIYGKSLVIEPHSYTDGFYYFAWDINERRGIKYEIEGGLVYANYGGSQTIRYVEGCA